MRNVTLQRALLLLASLSLGCVAPAATEPSELPWEAPAEDPSPEAAAETLRSLLAACAGPEMAERAWTACPACPTGECCFVTKPASSKRQAPGSQGLVTRWTLQKGLTVTHDKAKGTVRVSGTLTCSPRPVGLTGLTVFATTDPSGPRGTKIKTLARIDLKPDSVDPVPQFEDFRLPFILNISPEELTLIRGKDGKSRLSILGLVTSQDGPAYAGFLKLSF